MVLAGPTLDDSYSQAFGSLPKPYSPICVLYDPDPAAAEVTVQSVAVDDPFVQVLDVADCRYEGGPAWQAPACRPGQPLGIEPQYNGQDTRGCWFGIALAPAASREANYEDDYGASMAFSVVCVAVDDGPCGDETVVIEPGPGTKVTVTVSTRLRYCGQTEYADADGAPLVPDQEGQPVDPSVGSAANGCT